MKIALNETDGTIAIAELGVLYQTVASLGTLKWNKQQKVLSGYADLDMLTRLGQLVQLPPRVEAYRRRLLAVQQAMEAERVNPEPRAVMAAPVKATLFKHQQRAVNMCLLAFGVITPEQMGGGTP